MFRFSVFLFLFTTSFLWGQTKLQIDKSRLNRPAVAVVLSGGGAKGLAHIGALKVIERNGIPIDLVVGTSMGAVVGSLYAIGYSPDSLQNIVQRNNWIQTLTGLSGFSPQQVLSATQATEGKYALNVALKRQGALPDGLLPNQNINMMLSELMFRADSVKNFLKLPTPFVCMGTKMRDGEAVLLHEGSLLKSVRASMAIPGVFAPIDMDGELLFDGGVARNLPVQEAFDLGADIVIAVDVGWEPQTVESVKNFSDLMNQAVGIWIKEKSVQDREKATILIDPDVQGFNSFSFGDVAAMIERGQKAAEQVETQLQALKAKYNLEPRIPDYTFNLYEPFLDANRVDIRIIDYTVPFNRWHVNYSKREAVYEDLIRFTMNLKPDEVLTTRDLNKRLENLRTLGIFSNITYRLQQDGNEKVLLIEAIHDYRDQLGASFHYDPFLKSSVLLGLEMNNAFGIFPARLEAQVALREAWYVRVNPSVIVKGKPFFEWHLPLQFGELQQRLYASETAFTDYETPYLQVGTSLVSELDPIWNMELSIHYERTRQPNITNVVIPKKLRGLSLFHAQMDIRRKKQLTNFETIDIGTESNLSFHYNQMAEDASFFQLMLFHRQIVALKNRAAWFGTFQLGYTFGAEEIPLHKDFVLGGYINDPHFGLHHSPLFGYPDQFYRGKQLQFAAMGLRFRPYRQSTVAIQYQMGRIMKSGIWELIAETPFHQSLSLQIGYDIPRIGVVRSALMYNMEKFSLGFSVGRSF